MIAGEISLLIDWWERTDPFVAGVAFFLPVFVWFARSVIAECITSITAALASKVEVNITKDVQQGARPAVSVFCVALATYLALHVLMLPGSVAGWVEALVRLLLIFSIFWMIDAFVQCALSQASPLGENTKVIQKTWLPQFVRLLLATIFLVVLLKGWGIDLGPALTGLGIAGAAVAFAAQDLIRNLIAGINIAGEKRFSEGDWINFGAGTDGIVEKLQLRSTVIRKFDRSVIHVPNSELANAPLTNFSSRTVRRLTWKVRVPFDTDPARLNEVCDRLSEYIQSSPHLHTDENTPHFVKQFSIEESWITLLVDCFIKENDWTAELRAREELIFEIRRVFSEADVNFALPSQLVVAELNIPKNH